MIEWGLGKGVSIHFLTFKRDSLAYPERLDIESGASTSCLEVYGAKAVHEGSLPKKPTCLKVKRDSK